MTKIRARSSGSVRDRRGQGGGGGLGGLNFPMGGGGGGLPFPIKAGGGMLGIIILLATLFLPKLLGGLSGGSSAADVAPSSEDDPDEETVCDTETAQIVCGAVEDVQPYWTDQLPQSFGTGYEPTDTVFFSGFTNTGCGQASAQTGPFYCPLDKLVYFDLDFLVQLQEQFGASGDLAAQYIVAHEYGHHVQNVLGLNAQVHQAQQNDPARANEYSVALELQADCFAGAWARSAADRGKLDSRQEIEEAVNAAEAVGDDRIQQQTQGRVDPESWTHGSSQQRADWFRRGFDSADPTTCNTFDEIL
ncbi:MAG: KPN_02809 family neutral zinc metallopeptidase [Ilumatobacteraceae bacterium]